MKKVESAAEKVDTVSQQMNQILNKRAPLFQMMVGTPGRLHEEKKKEEAQSQK